jgi:protein-disulfide isomerase
MREQAAAMEPVDEAVDHVRGGSAGHVIVEYGDYECPYSRRAFREIERVEGRLGDGVRFAFRHFPLTEIHPHALAAATSRAAWPRVRCRARPRCSSTGSSTAVATKRPF